MGLMALEAAALHLDITLADGADGVKEPPREFRIFAKGMVDTTKGPFVFDEQSATQCEMAWKAYGNDLPVDYNHGMADIFVVDPAMAGKAAGWFKPQLRDGELWATQVEWTPPARSALMNREWRYMSPWFLFDGETRRVCELRNVALTNTPATKNLTPLMASRHGDNPTESPMSLSKLLAALGLAATATEADALTAIGTLSAQNTALSVQKSQVDELLSLTSGKTLSEALGTARAWKASHEALPAVQEKLSKLETASTEAELKRVLDEAVASGKVTPAARPTFEALGRKDLPQLAAMLSVMQPVMPGKKDPAAPPTGAVDTATLSAVELSVAKQMGISPEDYAKHKAARAKAN